MEVHLEYLRIMAILGFAIAVGNKCDIFHCAGLLAYGDVQRKGATV